MPPSDVATKHTFDRLHAAASVGRERRGYALLLIIFSSVLISFGGLIVRNIEAADLWQINLYRSLSMVAVVAGILFAQYRRDCIARVRDIGKPGLLASMLGAAAGICFLQALLHTTVANTLFTLSAIPFITAGLAWLLLKERLKRTTLITMVTAAVGVVIMVGDGVGAGSLFGNAMALATAVSFSGFAVIVRRYRHIDMLPTLLVASLIIVTIALVLRYDNFAVSLTDMMLCFLWGGLLSGLANWMFIIASRHLAAAEVTLVMLLEFALGPLWVWLFIGETASAATLAGGALVIVSVSLRATLELRRQQPPLKRGRPAGPG